MPWTGWVLLLLALFGITVSCASDDGASDNGSPSVAEVNEAGDRYEDQLDEYLTLGGDEPPGSIEGVDASFFEENEERLADLRSAYREWSGLLDDAVAEGNAPEGQDPDDVREYADLVDEWLTAQEEQAALSRECIDLIETQGERAASDCYAEMLFAHGEDWQETADRLNQFVPGG